MRSISLSPARRDRSFPSRRLPLTADSDLGVIILRMIATQSLSAFTPAVGRAEPVRGITPSQGTAGRAEPAAAAQKPLELVPPQPGRPMPRGSLLDLRV